MLDKLGAFSYLKGLYKMPTSDAVINNYRDKKSRNELQLWQRSTAPWVADGCDVNFAEIPYNRSKEPQLHVDPESVNWYNDFIVFAREYWMITNLVFALNILLIPMNCTGFCWKDRFAVDCHWCLVIFYPLMILTQLSSCVIETMAYASLSSHYGEDLIAPLRAAANDFAGCNKNLDIAISDLDEAVIYERSPGQTVSIIFGWLLLINFIVVSWLYLTIKNQYRRNKKFLDE